MGTFLFDECDFLELTGPVLKESGTFLCGNQDLDDFFNNDALLYTAQLLGKTYCFRASGNRKIVCAFTVSNDSIRVDDLPNSRGRKIKDTTPREKSMRRYPGVLLGRLGVSSEYQNLGIGSDVMDFIKSWFVIENKTGCRFIIVDAYNDMKTLAFYERNGFRYLFSSESQEYAYIFKVQKSEKMTLRTRLMYFDLISIFQ